MIARLFYLWTLIQQFPRGHLLATLGLCALTVTVIIAPEPGISRIDQQTLNLPLPEPRATPDELTLDATVIHDRDWIHLEVRSGDTLAGLLQSRGVSASAVHRLVTADPRLANLARIRPGDILKIDVNDQGDLLALKHEISRIEALHAEWQDAGWQVHEEKREYERSLAYARGAIQDSLFLSGQRAGLNDNQIMQLANIFGWDIDFVMDIRRDDEFQVLYEHLYLDGERVGTGNIIMATFNNRGRELAAYRYEKANGQTEYLDNKGNPMRRAFLRNPVDFARISSRFNLNRRHPVLNTIRAHRGVDYAAPTGTPIRAAGDGRVSFASVKGGYGNVVIIKHGQQYSTLYAHMNGFARGIRSGTRVRQGQVIGYVGMTGLATGPHLHYEFQVNGVHRDPLTVDLPRAESLPEQERPEFLAYAASLRETLALYAEASTLAQN